MGLQLEHLIVLLWLILSVNAEDCVYKECDCADGTIDCEFKELTQVPEIVYLSDDDRILLLSYNKITEITANSLPTDLLEIALLSNPTTIIEDRAFDESIYSLKTISLSSALFTRIPDAFGHLRALTSLSIQDVNVQDWNDYAMAEGGQTLTSLTLANVSLSSWPNWIQNLSQLTDLTITDSFIHSIPDGAFDNVSTSLTSLNLASNNLTSIPKALSQLLVLTSLNLEQNNIIDVTWLPQRSSLITLFLNNNKISNSSLLNEALRQIGSNLNYIGINYNQLTSIPDFSSMTKIANIDFSHNKISDPHSGSILPTVDSIELSYNFLPAIPRFVSTLHQASILNFPSNVITSFVGTDLTPSAIMLDLGYNLITELYDNSFPINTQLSTLYLNNNPIATIHNMAFTNLARLTELNLENTRITRLPLAFLSLTALSRLEMSDNSGLVCTCMENSLRSWIVNFPPFEVAGTCGEMGIYDFYSLLSLDCPTQ